MTKKFRLSTQFASRGAPDQRTWQVDGVERDLGRALSDGPFGLTPQTITDGHAVYAPGRHSGHIAFTVRLECPMVIGARRRPVSPREADMASAMNIVEPFLYKGKPAIPASSIKGLISTLVENASRSAYRVLKNYDLTVAYNPKGNHKNGWVRHVTGTKGATIGSVHSYFPSDALPPSVTRSEVSPAEAMFGYVRDDVDDVNRHVSVAGKIRPSHGVLTPEWAAKADDELYVAKTDFPGARIENEHMGKGFVVLKEQGQPLKDPPVRDPATLNEKSPRSATPSIYFQYKDDPSRPISKEKFATNPAGEFRANGTKYYMHHHAPNEQTPWATRTTAAGKTTGDDAKRKSAVRPVREGVTFSIEFAFDNFTDRELQLLCWALRPSEAFRHKIGLGKGLGLGSIRIDPNELTLIDRQKRYTAEGLFDDPAQESHDTAKIATWAEKHTAWMKAHDPITLNELLKIGETHPFAGGLQDEIPVLWIPMTEQQWQEHSDKPPEAEKKSFRWYAQNEKAGDHMQKLVPIGTSERIPTLMTKGAQRFESKPQESGEGDVPKGAEFGRLQPVSKYKGFRKIIRERGKGMAHVPDALVRGKLQKARDNERIWFILEECVTPTTSKGDPPVKDVGLIRKT